MVIHRNINSENILLDDNWRAKIVEFGRYVFLPSNINDDALYLNVIDSTNVYMDPEYVETGKLKRESDVYSFGVVMLEILCGMSAKKLMDREGGNDKGLAHLARRWLDEGIIKRMVNPQIKGENADNTFVLNKGTNEDFLDTFIAIMDKCLKLKQNQRPTMQVVIKELEKALSFQENNKDTLRLSFQDIKSATDNFTNCIGGGGFGGVFKGNFSHGDGTRHTIIVAKKLVGYSEETEEKIIVLENASIGSLDKHLNNARLTWHNRLKICIDVAIALDFLHGGVEGQDVVLHRDIKTANVLLFDDWKAKLSDFGLSLISTINKDSNYAIDHACGTKGYVDDSYLKSSTLTMESDIYSFGVVLFEILCGREINVISRNKSMSILRFIKQKIEEGKQGDMIFRGIKDEIMSKSLNAFLNIVCKCLDDNREKRPKSKEVLTQLKNAMELQVRYNMNAIWVTSLAKNAIESAHPTLAKPIMSLDSNEHSGDFEAELESQQPGSFPWPLCTVPSPYPPNQSGYYNKQ
ncbi:probable receptor-like protein kinase At2g23200 [Rutidosis leptorrhynchoides]|uniref:probable receptor-like protein kinase At2g23200 n=1 Tax=Rutidosis leptorrhynchoides TaxID=125765 RepID=UPI003A9957B2